MTPHAHASVIEHLGLDSRRRLVWAAREVFATSGVGPESMALTAERAGIDLGTALTLFEDEVELFAAVCEDEYLHRSLLVAEAFSRCGDPWQGMIDAVSRLLDRALEPGVQRITALDGPEVLGWERVQEISATSCLPVIGEGLRLLVAMQQLEGHDVPMLAGLLHGVMLQATLSIARAEDQTAARVETEREVRELLLGLARTPGD